MSSNKEVIDYITKTLEKITHAKVSPYYCEMFQRDIIEINLKKVNVIGVEPYLDTCF